jgi:hypothetical protein
VGLDLRTRDWQCSPAGGLGHPILVQKRPDAAPLGDTPGDGLHR